MKSKRRKRGAASPTSKIRLDAHVKRLKALELRLGGASFSQIAASVGFSGPGAAHKSVMAALEKTIQEPSRKVLEMELERLNRLWLPLWSRAQDGDMEAINICLRIMERRAKYHGLDYWELHEKQKLLEERMFGHADNRGHQVQPANDGTTGEGAPADTNGQPQTPTEGPLPQ